MAAEAFKLYIPVILGTARFGRESEKVARFIHDELRKNDGIEADFVDVKNYIESRTVPPWEEHNKLKEWREKAEKADAFIIVSPEYNRGYPGELKIFWDSAYKEYARKPVGIVGVSDGSFGGSRMIEHLRQVIIGVEAHPLKTAIYVSSVDKVFLNDGTVTDPAYEKRVQDFFEDLMWHAGVLKEGRKKTL